MPSKRTLRFDQLKLEGSSRAGDSTWIRVDPPGLAFDVGRGAVELSGCRLIFLTHGHLDHVLGLPFVLSYRGQHGLDPTLVHAPADLVEPLGRFLGAAAALEDRSYEYELIGMEPGDRVPVGRNLEVEAFAVRHGVPALGYHLLRTVRHLAPEHAGRSSRDLAEMRRDGVDVSRTREELWVSYCGDTGVEVFELEPRLFEAKILLLECTFLGDDAHDKAKRYGHLHIDDLATHQHRFANEAIVLHHLSRRHGAGELRRLVDERLGSIASRVDLLMGD